MTDLLRLAAFAGFLVLGAGVAAARGGVQRRRRTHVFLAYSLLLSWAVGLTQLDAWPFSSYRLANQAWVGASSRIHDQILITGVDAAGREWFVDPRAWSPIFPVTLQFFFKQTFPSLSQQRRDAVGAFLLSKAEQARALRAAGRGVGHQRWLGRLASPDWWLYQDPDGEPDAPYRSLRVYRESWIPSERVLDGSRARRHLLLETPRP